VQTSIILAPICAAALLLAGCGKSFNGAPPPQVAPVTAGTGTTASTSAGMTVPPESATSSAIGATRPSAESGRSNATMTRSQESNSMPMAGQNNDHSAPVAPDKSASAPR
jgi:hypothetical protein